MFWSLALQFTNHGTLHGPRAGSDPSRLRGIADVTRIWGIAEVSGVWRLEVAVLDKAVALRVPPDIPVGQLTIYSCGDIDERQVKTISQGLMRLRQQVHQQTMKKTFGSGLIKKHNDALSSRVVGDGIEVLDYLSTT